MCPPGLLNSGHPTGVGPSARTRLVVPPHKVQLVQRSFFVCERVCTVGVTTFRQKGSAGPWFPPHSVPPRGVRCSKDASSRRAGCFLLARLMCATAAPRVGPIGKSRPRGGGSCPRLRGSHGYIPIGGLTSSVRRTTPGGVTTWSEDGLVLFDPPVVQFRGRKGYGWVAAA